MRIWGVWLFLHLIGAAFWLGGMFTLSLWTSRARKSGDAEVVAFSYDAARRLYNSLVAVGSILTVVAGAILMFATGRTWLRPFPEHWLFQMQVFGLIAFLLTLAIVIPNAGRLAELAARKSELEEDRARFAGRVRQQAIAGSLVGAILIYVILIGALRI